MQIQAARVYIDSKEQTVKRWEDIDAEGEAVILTDADMFQETLKAIFPMGLTEAAKRFLQEYQEGERERA